jgi:hypothetical protein
MFAQGEAVRHAGDVVGDRQEHRLALGVLPGQSTGLALIAVE